MNTVKRGFKDIKDNANKAKDSEQRRSMFLVFINCDGSKISSLENEMEEKM